MEAGGLKITDKFFIGLEEVSFFCVSIPLAMEELDTFPSRAGQGSPGSQAESLEV